MNKDLEKVLVEKYPTLYKDYRSKSPGACMRFGFECHDGWFKLIDDLSAKLSKFDIVASQVKEKFGGLRFYIGPCKIEDSDEVFGYIGEAEDLSLKTCEICGNEGELQDQTHWLKVRCENCT